MISDKPIGHIKQGEVVTALSMWRGFIMMLGKHDWLFWLVCGTRTFLLDYMTFHKWQNLNCKEKKQGIFIPWLWNSKVTKSCQDPLLQGKSRKLEMVSNLPTGCEGLLMIPNKFWNTRREQRMIQRLKVERQKCWEVLRHSESWGEFRRESHSSLRWGQTIIIPKRYEYMHPKSYTV